jgi:uridylate kinase
MVESKDKTIVISLGGSALVPAKIDTVFLHKFRQLILGFVNKGYRFVIVCGGGKPARDYQNAALAVVKMVPEDLDWLGIHATRLNAHLLRTIFRKVAYSRVIKNPTEDIKLKQSDRVIMAAGWKPGRSTDHIAVLLAKNLGAKTVINITSANQVYTKDPRSNSDAKPIKKLSWKEFKKVVGITKWSPGLNTPFDPVAAKQAEQLKLKVVVLGKDIDNLENFLHKKSFKGTTIN